MRQLACPHAQALSDRDAAAFADTLWALAHPVRMRLLSLVLTSPGGMTVMQLTEALEFRTQSTVTHHMNVLADAGFVTRVKRSYPYRIVPGALEYVAQFLGGGR